VFSVSLWLTNPKQKHTTETQRTQRLHREEGLRDFLCKAFLTLSWGLRPRIYAVTCFAG